MRRCAGDSASTVKVRSAPMFEHVRIVKIVKFAIVLKQGNSSYRESRQFVVLLIFVNGGCDVPLRMHLHQFSRLSLSCLRQFVARP